MAGEVPIPLATGSRGVGGSLFHKRQGSCGGKNQSTNKQNPQRPPARGPGAEPGVGLVGRGADPRGADGPQRAPSAESGAQGRCHPHRASRRAAAGDRRMDEPTSARRASPPWGPASHQRSILRFDPGSNSDTDPSPEPARVRTPTRGRDGRGFRPPHREPTGGPRDEGLGPARWGDDDDRWGVCRKVRGLFRQSANDSKYCKHEGAQTKTPCTRDTQWCGQSQECTGDSLLQRAELPPSTRGPRNPSGGQSTWGGGEPHVRPAGWDPGNSV